MQLTRTQVACLSLCAQQTGGRALLRPIAIVCYGSSFNGSIQCARMLVKQLVVMGLLRQAKLKSGDPWSSYCINDAGRASLAAQTQLEGGRQHATQDRS